MFAPAVVHLGLRVSSAGSGAPHLAAHLGCFPAKLPERKHHPRCPPRLPSASLFTSITRLAGLEPATIARVVLKFSGHPLQRRAAHLTPPRHFCVLSGILFPFTADPELLHARGDLPKRARSRLLFSNLSLDDCLSSYDLTACAASAVRRTPVGCILFENL